MRELMIALIVASTLISVAEAFYKMATPANANFEAHDAGKVFISRCPPA